MRTKFSSEKIEIGIQYRFLELKKNDINIETRSIEVAFSSEEPFERCFGFEILDHQPKSIRLDRIRSGGPLLYSHNPEYQIGVIEKVEIGADRKGRAVVRFGKGAQADEIYRDVIDGIRRNISVGYQVHKLILEKEEGNTPTYRAIDWEPLEISVISIPADIKVGFGRQLEKSTIIDRSIKMPEEIQEKKEVKTDGLSVNVRLIEDEAREKERARIREINAIADKHKCQDLAREYTFSGKSLEEFRAAVLERIYNAVPIIDQNPAIGMTEKEVRSYSLLRAMRLLSDNLPLDGLEKEASDAVTKISKREAKGFFIPHDVMISKRAAGLSASVAPDGGFTIGTEVLGASMIELLRNKMLIASLGARVLGGIIGNILIPKHSGGGTAYWLSEAGAATGSKQAFGQLALSPHRLAADTAYTKELIFQSSIDIENFVRQDLMAVLAIEKDRACINGLGANGEPLGILNTTGIKTVTFGAAATWAKVIDFETQIAGANADVGSMAYITTPAVRGKWKSAVKVTNQASFLWENSQVPGSGMVNGYRAEATLQVPSDKVLFANWNDLIIADWAGIDVVVDPYSLKKSGEIEVTITMWTDTGVRHPVSFCASTDSGAQ